MATVCPKGATMIVPVRRTGIAAALLVAAMTACRPAPRASSGTGTHDRTVLSQALPAMDGRGLRVTVLEVTYGRLLPTASSSLRSDRLRDRRHSPEPRAGPAPNAVPGGREL